ncbi:EAL domain-containing protein [Pontixanthobacter aestiaquae]|uniref:EAL domain-containing protein n=1 Tax=Pontixanthobacter aestiaquae TaxID=1509367 RepID=A0A844ZBU6_9SPHN|nr:EAL domain-containing protein [Pontixanthobacter aestiaquae]MDN3645694.1 EAL domain-containing protein [Pontixanthobacter aestiaquae]MXO83309.1 EAL domain-containing protein [Pontixanthobacter aestiaquae]
MSEKNTNLSKAKRRIERDIVALGIAVAAILMFVGTGSAVLPQILRSWMSGTEGPDNFIVNALLLNIALIIFGMRRYRELVVEIEHRREAEETAKTLAETDPLTGCLNRRSIMPATDALIADCADGHEATAFLMVDLDNFKQINDLNGHKVGDEVLENTANRMRRVLPPTALLARLGGDEFACVLKFDSRSPDTIDQIATQLIAGVAKPQVIDGMSIEITISVGIATSVAIDVRDKEKPEAQLLMHRSDIAMYHAKGQGKNRYFWFESSMENELRFRNEIETGIRRGISAGEFVPYYEQQIDLETGKLVGFEMLARWKSPELGIVNPTIFIPVAEEIGVIAQLSEQLIEQALTDAKEWDPNLTLSVNISPVQLRDPWFSQKLLKILVKHNFPPSRLEIEITESCIHENIGVVRSMITSLKNQGVKISLDDFGTGYASLSQLRSLPFDRLKIDRSFVGELTDEDSCEKIVSAIISMGDGLKMPITAEGVEDERILEALQGKGPMKAQGYHYGRPESAADVRKRLEPKGLLSRAGEPPKRAEEPTESAFPRTPQQRNQA